MFLFGALSVYPGCACHVSKTVFRAALWDAQSDIMNVTHQKTVCETHLSDGSLCLCEM